MISDLFNELLCNFLATQNRVTFIRAPANIAFLIRQVADFDKIGEGGRIMQFTDWLEVEWRRLDRNMQHHRSRAGLIRYIEH